MQPTQMLRNVFENDTSIFSMWFMFCIHQIFTLKASIYGVLDTFSMLFIRRYEKCIHCLISITLSEINKHWRYRFAWYLYNMVTSPGKKGCKNMNGKCIERKMLTTQHYLRSFWSVWVDVCSKSESIRTECAI